MLDSDHERRYVHLNTGRWDGFGWWGLEMDEGGALFLASLPRPVAAPPPAAADAPNPDAPSGVAVTPDRTLFYTDPSRDLLMRRAPCDGPDAPVPCAGGSGGGAGEFRQPRGLAYHPVRDALVLADAGNHRLQLLGVPDARVLGVWGQSFATPSGAGSEPGRFDTPWAVAVDPAGHTYVVDHGNRRVQKLDLDGRPLDVFRRRVEATGLLSRPVDVAVRGDLETTEVFVLDIEPCTVVVFDGDGNLLRRLDRMPGSALGLAVAPSGIYVGDHDRRRLLRLAHDGTRVGHAPAYEGPIAALTLDHGGHLWLHPGGHEAPVQFLLQGAHVHRGRAVERADRGWRRRPRLARAGRDWHAAAAGRGDRAGCPHLRRCGRRSHSARRRRFGVPSRVAPVAPARLPRADPGPLPLPLARGTTLGRRRRDSDGSSKSGSATTPLPGSSISRPSTARTRSRAGSSERCCRSPRASSPTSSRRRLSYPCTSTHRRRPRHGSSGWADGWRWS